MATRDDIFEWAIRNNKRLPMTSGDYINMPAARAFHKEETAREKIGNGNSSEALSERAKREKRDDDGKFAAGGGKEDAPDVVELDENSELMKRVEGLKGRARTKAIANYIVEVLGGRSMTLHDGISAVVDNADLIKMAQDAFPHGRGLRRTTELGEIAKIIDNARYSHSDYNARHNKFSAFRYYAVKTRYKGEDETILLNIGKNKFTGKYNFYTITVDDDK